MKILKKGFLSLSIVSMAVLSSCGDSQEVESKKDYKLVQEVAKTDSSVNIPFKRFEFENGLTLIVHEDHSDPIVHVDVTYHVGSAREELGRSGFAHFFEHMMFQGSDNVADEQHFKIVTESGGSMNGTTNLDRTNYFETLPSNQLETALWLEADRMGFLLDAVTQKKFEVQRGTVKNERGQNYDNRPYGLFREKLSQAIYEYGHPYSWPTIGYIEDLNRVDVEDLKKFFLRWYGPNNAVLTIAGDVNTDNVTELVHKYFGNIPMGPVVNPQAKTREVITEDRYISLEDEKIRFPMISMNFPTVPRNHPDEAPLDVLSDILGGGKNSIFYQNFTKTRLAVQASVSNPCQELAGNLGLTILTYPITGDGEYKSLADYEKLMRSSIAEFETRGVTDEDLTRYKSSTEAYMIQSLSSVSGKASSLASYHTFLGNPDQFENDLNRYLNVTKEDVIRVYNTYVKDKNCVIISLYPEGQENIVAAPNNYEVKLPDPAEADHKEYEGLVYNKAVDDSTIIVRSKQPAAGASPSIVVPPYWTETMENGLQIIGTVSKEVPMTTVRLSVDCGHKAEPMDKAGIASLMSAMMNESTASFSSEEIAEKLEILGSSISVHSGKESVDISITSLTKNMDETMKLANEMIFHPAFNDGDFERVMKQHMAGLENMSTSGRTIASQAVNKLMYGSDNILSLPNDGTMKSAASISLEDVKKYYASSFSPNISRMVIVGNMSKEEVLPKMSIFTSWVNTNAEVSKETGSVQEVTKTRMVLIHQDGAEQSEIRIAKMAMPYDATGDYYKTRLMNFPFAGNFNSRVNLYIREEKNWSYGTGASLYGGSFNAPYSFYGGILKNATDSAIVKYIDFIQEYQANGATDEEISFLKSAIGQKDALKYETGRQKAGFISNILKYNLTKTFSDEQATILKNITKEEINEIAKNFLNMDEMTFIIVGDKAIVGEGLKAIAEEQGFDYSEMTIKEILGN